jgi:hypothetical protein
MGSHEHTVAIRGSHRPAAAQAKLLGKADDQQRIKVSIYVRPNPHPPVQASNAVDAMNAELVVNETRGPSGASAGPGRRGRSGRGGAWVEVHPGQEPQILPITLQGTDRDFMVGTHDAQSPHEKRRGKSAGRSRGRGSPGGSAGCAWRRDRNTMRGLGDASRDGRAGLPGPR